jgi:DNA-directed RNA polymerase subunit K/omega
MSSYFDETENENDVEGTENDIEGTEDDSSLEEDEVEDDDEVEDEVEVEVEVEDDDEVEDEVEDDDEDVEEDDEDDDDDKNNLGKGEDSELEEGELDSAEEAIKNANKKKKIPSKKVYKPPTNFMDDDEEDDDDDGEQYLQKFDQSVNENYILNFHPESVLQNYDEILSMTKVIRNANGLVIDKLHRTIPFLTKYEKSRILGQRAKQINSGAYPFVKVPENVIDGYIIAELELKQQRIPFIIRRPMPNGGSEYWKVKDLEDIAF